MIIKPSFVFCVFVIFLMYTGCTTHMDIPSNGVSYELNEQRKFAIDHVAYELEFYIPEKKKDAIEGKIKVSFDLKTQDNPLVLDFSNEAAMIHSVVLNSIEVAYTFENEHIIIDAKKSILGHNILEISFTAGDLSLNRNEDFLYTLFVPDRASTCFPLFDQPNMKATYALTLYTPVGWEALSNGAVIAKRKVENKWIYQFEKTKPISSYLFAFTTGKFFKQSRQLKTREINIFYRETDTIAVKRNMDEIFRLHDQSLNWLENYTGIPYPFEKFDIALIPSFQYGGMEHPGAIFYNESSLILEENPTVNKRMSRASVIAHESAHMWFGDLVTMEWFNDVWLKEVFANFMAAKIVHPSFPEINHDLRFLLAHYPAAYDVDRTAGTNPILQQLDNLKNAGTMYGAIIYQKAPVVMKQLELKIGEKIMQESMRDYLQRFSFGNASWDDLVAIIDSKTILDIKAWSNVWVKTSDMPIYDFSNSGGNFFIKQVKDSISNRLWQQQFQYTILNNQVLTNIEIGMDSISKSVSIRDDSTKIFLNTNGVGYGYFKMNIESRNYFISNYNTFIDPVFKGAMMVNIWEGFLHGDGKAADDFLKDLLELLKIEKNPILVEYILGNLGHIWWQFLSEKSRSESQLQVETSLWTSIIKSQNDGIKNSYFNSYKNIGMSENALRNLTDLWKEKLKIPGLILSESDKISIVMDLAVKEAVDHDLFLKQQLQAIKNPDRKRKMAFVMPALSSDEHQRDLFFESLKNPKNREKEAWVLEALHYLHHPLRQKSAIKYLQPSMEMLQEIQLTGDIFFPTRWINTTFEGHSSTEAAKIAQDFLYNEQDYPLFLRNKILQATDILNRSVKIKK